MFLMSLVGEARRMAPSLSRGTSFVYVLRLRSGGLYIGCSTNLEKRFGEHERGKACRTTKLDPPKSVAWIENKPIFPPPAGVKPKLKNGLAQKRRHSFFKTRNPCGASPSQGIEVFSGNCRSKTSIKLGVDDAEIRWGRLSLNVRNHGLARAVEDNGPYLASVLQAGSRIDVEPAFLPIGSPLPG